ncbi:MAG: hypothetical protein ACR2RB_22875 [Gammaproteobacteria bacterium]
MNRNLLAITIALLAPLALTACYESTDVVVHEPGVYKGAEDPLLSKAPETEKLIERFRLVQVDR